MSAPVLRQFHFWNNHDSDSRVRNMNPYDSHDSRFPSLRVSSKGYKGNLLYPSRSACSFVLPSELSWRSLGEAKEGSEQARKESRQQARKEGVSVMGEVNFASHPLSIYVLTFRLSCLAGCSREGWSEGRKERVSVCLSFCLLLCDVKLLRRVARISVQPFLSKSSYNRQDSDKEDQE